MTNGFTGTGISIIFYLLLALFMPIIYVVRLLRKRSIHRLRFVLRHFLYAATIAATVLLGISYITAVAGLSGRGNWHLALNLGARGVACILLVWTLTPLLVRLWLRIKHIAPLNLPDLPVEKRRPARRFAAIDSIMSYAQWRLFSDQLYGAAQKEMSPPPSTVVKSKPKRNTHAKRTRKAQPGWTLKVETSRA